MVRFAGYEDFFRQYQSFGFFEIFLLQNKLMASAYNRRIIIFFYFQSTLYRLHSNCIKLHRYWIIVYLILTKGF